MDAVWIEVVHRRRHQRSGSAAIQAISNASDRKVNVSDPGKHAGFITRVKLPIEIDDEIVGSRKIRIAQINMTILAGPQDPTEAVREVELLHDLAGLEVALVSGAR